MKKQLCHMLILQLLLLVIFVLSACQSNTAIPEGYYPYEKDKVESAVNSLSFQPEIPEYVPIQAEFLISDQYVVNETDSEALDISFYTRDNALLSIQFIDGKIDKNTVNSETVKINEQLEGKYVDNSYARILYWEKNGINYKMTFRSNTVDNKMEKDNEITKSKLVEVARSFHS